ncbi:hypothetical protein FOB58_001142 [Candida parapsilosis]|uniref:TPR_REGION domain-containing protein n=2 Tax=Candida parapsilosis TaxID=5480 RepID=G8BFJ6_CANPC|nr:uncharacterized protein CPAR2_202730 [Candida parapsilosis]KAF6055220.1 hypothetical protein FOB58_001142 [Candida parapsilosis]KAF6055757.1 hypothetical protein FOB59_000269 [Candida parapsilosis]KAF6058687.1 hypothetical protein FOB60_000269 [Candida parapsilosis]KAF6067444.1 hypothetical protein FOB61_000269 [Candida parapsilosis]KAI5901354.1 Assembly chaperone of RPL4 [Candida parapsilosis]
MNDIIPQARGFLSTSQPEKALEILTPHIASNSSSPEFLAILGETLLENNELKQAYNVLIQACELDPDASLGVEKFLYLGQIIGGADGLNYINTGLNKLNEILANINEGSVDEQELAKSVYRDVDEYKAWVIKKLNSGIFASIEIWMTDLCMEPEAESKCNELIDYSLSIDAENPESLSILSSIRISQQRQQEAVEALNKSWELFKLQKTKLEDFANTKETKEGGSGNGEDAFEVGLEYVELIQPLVTLSRYAIELEQYDTAIDIASNIQDINDSILDAFYIEALANLFKAKQMSTAKIATNSDEFDDYRELEISQLKNTPEIKQLLADSRLILTSAYKIVNSELGDENDPVLVQQVNELLNQLGGPIMSELMPKRENLDDEDVDWEAEIVSGDEE